MSHLFFVERNGQDKIDSRLLLKEMSINNHKQWMYRMVFSDIQKFEEQTGDKLDIDYEKNEKGKPTRFAWLTESQFYFLIAKAKNSTDVIRCKAMLSQKLSEYRAGKTVMKQIQKNVWQDRLDKILVPTMHDSKAGEVMLSDPKWVENKFSPDEKFIKFLSQVESETGYILPWNFDFDAEGILTYPRQYQKYIDTYREITETDDVRILAMWGTEELPPLPDEPYLVPANDVSPVGGVWLDEPPICKEKWREFIQCVREVVEAYNDPKRKEKYGIPSPHEVETDYEDLEEDTMFLKKTLKAYNRFNKFYKFKHKVLGFQAHKDWLRWLKSEDKMAETMRQFYLGFTSEVYFYLEKCEDEDGDEYYKASRGSFVVVYPHWADIKDGKSWSQLPFDHPSNFGDEPPRSPDAPLFRRVRFYDEKYEPLFDWYLENIWLPQQGLKFFKECDPKGYPQLALLLKDLPSSTALPKMFVQSVQKQLAASTR